MSTPVTIIPDGVPMVEDIGADRMRELQKFAELGRLSATLLHEISNPLTATILHLEQYHDQASPNIRHAKRNVQLLQRYVDAARQQVRMESEPINFYVRPQLSQIRRILIPIARRRGVRLYFTLDANHRIYGDPVKFQQIMSNLISNAIDSYRPIPLQRKNRVVHIRIMSRGHWLVAKILDMGVGIEPDELPHVFEPFFSTKIKKGVGLGIGLTVVKQYVENDFSGSIAVTSSRNKGTQFTVRLRTTPRYTRKIVGI